VSTVGGPRVRGYRSERRDEQARSTRRRIVAAAAEEFRSCGYAGTTVRAVARSASVSPATVELAFGTKAALLKAAIDEAIAGDDEPVAVLDRDWAAAAESADDTWEFLARSVAVLGPAMARSAGLVSAVLAPGAPTELADLRDRLVDQRARTAGWLVDQLAAHRGLRTGLTREEAVDTVWMLMDPAVYLQLTRFRGWDLPRYQGWIAGSLTRLLTPDHPRAEEP
jgi:AcrR family transcriptional regulator